MLFADTDADGEGEILLTERAHHMRSHPGQVSFPGGTIDPGETAVEAALREAEEEIALDPTSIEVFGELPELWLPPSNFAVTPVLGWWRERGEVGIASPDEVHEIHHVPISELLDPPAPHQRAPPQRLARPGLPHRARPRRHPVGLHRRDHRPALRLPRVDDALGRGAGA